MVEAGYAPIWWLGMSVTLIPVFQPAVFDQQSESTSPFAPLGFGAPIADMLPEDALQALKAGSLGDPSVTWKQAYACSAA